MGFPVIITASPAYECMGHYGPGGRPWVFPCSVRKRGKASARDVALSLGSCIQSVVQSVLEGVLGGWLR